MKKMLVMLLINFWIGCSWACSPMRAINIYFSENSHNLSANQVIALGNFLVSIKSDFPNHQSIELTGGAERAEPGSKQLAIKRIKAVAEYFERTKYRQSPIIVNGTVHVEQASKSIDPRRVELVFLPNPPHACDSFGRLNSVR